VYVYSSEIKLNLKIFKTYILITILTLIGYCSFGQDTKQETILRDNVFTVRGKVYEKGTRNPYKNVQILINGGSYTTTGFDGDFTVKTKIGDELIVSHDDFETIYYKIESNERIYIEVVSDTSKLKQNLKRSAKTEKFHRLIDSADTYLKKDAAKSISFIGDALKKTTSTKQSAVAQELLGDVYTFWKQYDLAISAYKISLQNAENNSTKLKLAKAYLNNNDYENSILIYNSINISELSNYQKTIYYEGWGDAHLKSNFFDKAISAYKKGLDIAQNYSIQPKATDLNSKIAQAYGLKGNKNKANDYFKNSLNLAAKENKKRAVEEKVKVAEFNNENADYDAEINLRKEAIEDVKAIEKDSMISNESAITLQKQNYKIASIFALKKDYDSAIPYYEESIKEATKKEDLEVKKDALRGLSEVQFNRGDAEKGVAAINEFKNVVDELYAKKVQEISRAARLSKNLAEQQNRITSLESDRELSRSKYELTQERNKSQQLIIYSLIGGLILFLIAGFLMFKYIKQQRLANNLLALKSLRSQMNPHFIFNALNSVNSFIATNDERTANKYLSDFSHLMRSVLENSEEDFISLKKEIELIELYTKLEHFRFQDKFDYRITVNETIDTENFQIPPMLLQPYIENAVWHGLRYKTEKGHLDISIEPKSKNEITITIADDGIGRERSKTLKTKNQKKQNSKGMNNIQKRVAILNEMYKDKVDVTINDFQDLKDVGTNVAVTLKKD